MRKTPKPLSWPSHRVLLRFLCPSHNTAPSQRPYGSARQETNARPEERSVPARAQISGNSGAVFTVCQTTSTTAPVGDDGSAVSRYYWSAIPNPLPRACSRGWGNDRHDHRLRLSPHPTHNHGHPSRNRLVCGPLLVLFFIARNISFFPMVEPCRMVIRWRRGYQS